jgi:hypothetical protein
MTNAPRMTNLVYVAFGPTELHIQALYSIYSALAYRGDAALDLRLYTDQRTSYRPVADQITIHELAPEKLLQWRGREDFPPFRVKIAALEEIARAHPRDNVLFVDADTFFVQPLAPLLARIDENHAVMHMLECRVSTHPTGQLRRLRRNLRKLRFRGAPVDVNIDMWNSGVVGLHPAQFAVLPAALEFLDTTWQSYRKGFVEQFALSWLLQKQGVEPRPAADFVFHYWYQKPEYQAAIERRLARWQDLPLEAALDELRQERIAFPPPPIKRSLGEKFLERVLRRPIPDTRGLPPPSSGRQN